MLTIGYCLKSWINLSFLLYSYYYVNKISQNIFKKLLLFKFKHKSIDILGLAIEKVGNLALTSLSSNFSPAVLIFDCLRNHTKNNKLNHDQGPRNSWRNGG